MTKNKSIAVFSYNRPKHLSSVLTDLEFQKNISDFDVHLFCDGIKNKKDLFSVIFNMLAASSWANKTASRLHLKFRNQGLACSIKKGVDRLLNKYKSVTVVEDDLRLSKDFLEFHSRCLDFYEDHNDIYQISGHTFVENMESKTPSFFPIINTWGWSTWRRARQHFDLSATGWPADKASEIRRSFDLDGSYPFSRLLDGRLLGNNQSWGILWYWSVFQKHGLVVYPPVSLVANHGFDGSGTHCERAELLAPPPRLRLDMNTFQFLEPEWPSADLLNQLKQQISKLQK